MYSPGYVKNINIGGGGSRENEDEDAASGGGGGSGSRNHNGHVGEKGWGGGGNMNVWGRWIPARQSHPTPPSTNCQGMRWVQGMPTSISTLGHGRQSTMPQRR